MIYLLNCVQSISVRKVCGFLKNILKVKNYIIGYLLVQALVLW